MYLNKKYQSWEKFLVQQLVVNFADFLLKKKAYLWKKEKKKNRTFKKYKPTGRFIFWKLFTIFAVFWWNNSTF